MRPVQAEPVKVTTSWPVTWSSRSPTEPEISCSAPSGRMPDSTIRRTIELGQVGGLARGLDDAGTPAISVGAIFSSMPQKGKLKALMWTATPSSGVRMCWAEKLPSFDRSFDVAVDEEAGVRQLAAGLGGVGEQRADAALDVDPAVGAGGAGGEALGVELLLALHQVLAERLQHRGALVEGQAPQRRAADVAAVGEHGGEVEAGGVDHGDRRAGGGVEERAAAALAADPAAGDVAFELAGLVWTSTVMGWSSGEAERGQRRVDRSGPVGQQRLVRAVAQAEARQRLEVGGVGAAEAVGDLRLPVGDRGLGVGAASSLAAMLGEARDAELGVALLARGDGARRRRAAGRRRGPARRGGSRGAAHQDVHHDRVDPALDRVVEDGEAHVAAVPGLPRSASRGRRAAQGWWPT